MTSSVLRLTTAAALLFGAAAAQADTYQIQIDNLVPGGPATGQALTPTLVVVHNMDYTLWAVGGTATKGLELQAEEGDPSVLKAEADASPDVFATAVGGGPFFDTDIIMIEGNPGERISISTMLARTNDLITGVSSMMLPDDELMVMTNAYDAGTEENTGLVEHIPFYGNSGGPSEKGTIELITEYSVLDDPDQGRLDWSFPPVARITITRMGSTPTEESSWSAIKALY